MITKNLDIEIIKIIKSVVKKYTNVSRYEYEDLYFEGIIEAIKAVDEYDNTKGIKLTTYVYSRVKYKMIYLIRKERAIKRDVSKNINLEMMLAEHNQDIYDVQMKNNNLENQIINSHLKQQFHKDLKNILTEQEYFYLSLLLEGYTVRDIARKTKLTAKQVSNKIYYIKKKLKKNKKDFENYRNLF